MDYKEILETYVEEILYNTDTGNIFHDVSDFYEVIGMVRLAYVYGYIESFEKTLLISKLKSAILYIQNYYNK